ncbi:hypothetical protein DV515_00005383 [Chloebia gouldiae]|uniref:CCHC-type domain-containing protein n=1 Tax=Chloebia gouldiae TaxID=44316 RepID=A0A3L8SPM9_CHLGU|nr:hypothetical protein DV515_00005383 [Chloebia gouldiae]
MRLARAALDKIKALGGTPSYMTIKQGREEYLGTFVDRVAAAIENAGAQDFMKGPLLTQCILQNGNPTTRSLLQSMGGNWTIEELLEWAANLPVGPQAMLVEVINNLGAGLKEQAASAQSQVLAALVPLHATAASHPPLGLGPKCFRCGVSGHIRRECHATNIWCQNCRSNSHATSVCHTCHRQLGNGKASAKPRCTLT